MGQHIATVAALATYCAAMLVIGFSFAVIAYRLLSNPVATDGSGGRRPGGSREAWGAFFALVAVVVVGMSIWMGWSITNYVPRKPPQEGSQTVGIDVEEVTGPGALAHKWIVEINFRKARTKAAGASTPESTAAPAWGPPAATFSSRPLAPVGEMTHKY